MSRIKGKSGVYERIPYHRQRLKESHIGLKYKPMSEEGRRNISEAHKGKLPVNWNSLYTPEINEKRRIARLKYKIPKKDTSLELKVKTYLDEQKIPYIHPFNVRNRYQSDFFLPSPNLIVECDGAYWHSSIEAKKRDEIRDIYIKKQGFDILRLKEEEIIKGRFQLKLKIIELLNQL